MEVNASLVSIVNGKKLLRQARLMYPVQSVAEAAHDKKMPRNSTTRPSESLKKSSFKTNKNATVGRSL